MSELLIKTVLARFSFSSEWGGAQHVWGVLETDAMRMFGSAAVQRAWVCLPRWGAAYSWR